MYVISSYKMILSSGIFFFFFRKCFSKEHLLKYLYDNCKTTKALSNTYNIDILLELIGLKCFSKSFFLVRNKPFVLVRGLVQTSGKVGQVVHFFSVVATLGQRRIVVALVSIFCGFSVLARDYCIDGNVLVSFLKYFKHRWWCPFYQWLKKVGRL